MQKLGQILLAATLFFTSALPLAQVSDIPAAVRDLRERGESIVPLTPISFGDAIYQVYLFTTEELAEPPDKLLYEDSADALAENGVRAVVVTCHDDIVTDPDIIHWVLTLARTGYLLHYTPDALYDSVIPPEVTLKETVESLRTNPLLVLFFAEQHVSGLFSTPEEEVAEALRGMFTAQAAQPQLLEEFAADVQTYLDVAGTVEEAVDRVISMNKYSNHRRVREWARIARKSFDGWERKSGTVLETKSGPISFVNGLELVGLGVRLISLADLQEDRADWLKSYRQIFGGTDARLGEDQLLAADQVLVEVTDDGARKATVILEFVKDNLAELFTDYAREQLVKTWADFSWKIWGTRTTGHLAAGAASKVLLVYTIANLLYGMDDIYHNFTVADRTEELWHQFEIGRQMMINQDWSKNPSFYEGEKLEAYRVATLLEGLAAAQMYRSYSDGVASSRVLFLVGDLIWDDGWTEAIEWFRTAADDIELGIDERLGHPAIVEEAVNLSLLRLGLMPEVVDPVLDARVTSPPELLLLQAGDEGAMSFDLENSGTLAWEADGSLALVNTNQLPLQAEPSQPLMAQIPPGEAAHWAITVTAPADIGWYASRWQMAESEEPFGDEVLGMVVVLPDGEIELDPATLISSWFEGLLAQFQAELDARWQELLAEVEAWLRSEAESKLAELQAILLNQCCGLNLTVAGLLLAGGLGLRSARRPGGKKGGTD